MNWYCRLMGNIFCQSRSSPRRSGRKVKQRILYGHERLPGGAQLTPQQSEVKKTKRTPESGSDDEEEETEETG